MFFFKQKMAYEVIWLLQFKLVVFLSQAEDGIRDDLVTGVQRCALPISLAICSTPSTPLRITPTSKVACIALEVVSRTVTPQLPGQTNLITIRRSYRPLHLGCVKLRRGREKRSSVQAIVRRAASAKTSGRKRARRRRRYHSARCPIF